MILSTAICGILAYFWTARVNSSFFALVRRVSINIVGYWCLIWIAGCVRITDYGVERKICEFYQTFNKLPDVPDKFPPSIGRGGKKGDIYRFGVILLSVINGSCVQNPPEIPNVLPPDLQDFFRKLESFQHQLLNTCQSFFSMVIIIFFVRCLTPIEHSRYSATDLLDHEFLKLPLFADSPLKLQPKIDENIQTVTMTF